MSVVQAVEVAGHAMPFVDPQVDIVEEISSGRMPNLFRQFLGRNSRILLETELLLFLPTVSPLAFGHMLAFSKRDHTSFADLLGSRPQSLAQLRYLHFRYEQVFGPAVCFEHGSHQTGGHACGVSRAHFHFIPSPNISLGYLIDRLRSELGEPDARRLDRDFVNLSQTEYLVVGSLEDDLAVWANVEIPSQVTRRVIAAQLGLQTWDWRELSSWDLVQQTLGAWPR
jgi:hypothetical protein